MRITDDPNDPDFVGTKTYDVLLDGVPQKYVHVADDVAGTIVVTKADAQGQPVNDGDNWVLESKQGKVELRLLDLA